MGKEKKDKEKKEDGSKDSDDESAFILDESPEAIQVFGMSYSGGRLHVIGNVPNYVTGVLKKFCRERQKDGNKQIQFLQSAAENAWLGGSEYIITKCDDTYFFRLHVAISRAVLRDGWSKFDDQKYGGAAGMENNMILFMKDPTK
ncbi:hypothetical protein QOT17_015958 [Balamuthia mandrillaris]